LPENITLQENFFYGDHISYPFVPVDGNPPAAPSNLTGTAVDYYTVSLGWEYTQDPQWPARALILERKIGTDGDWTVLDGNIDPAPAADYLLENLNDDTVYYFRLRANNIFGYSDYTDETMVTTSKDPRLKAVFQEGLNGYAGTIDLELRNAQPDTVFDGATSVSVDQDDGGVVDALIRFKNVIGDDEGQVPPDAIVTGASIRFMTSSSTANEVFFYQMLMDWPDAATWNTFGTDGLSLDDVEAKSVEDDVLIQPDSDDYVYADVTSSLQAWMAGQENYGWGMINSGGDGWDFRASENELLEVRPMLTVYYVTSGTNNDGVVDKCKVKAAEKGDKINFSGQLDAIAADFDAAMGGNAIVSIEADDIPDIAATTFTFPINEDSLNKGRYKSKAKGPGKDDPVTSLQIDTNKGKMKFSGKKLDLTGLSCPITITIQIGDYSAEIVLDEDIVNGPKKPCPPELMDGI
jgi:hypothetical protein